ncbi:MAG: hypothetical protein Q7S08_00355 [bacterium]|nr:hypothetical protein [bacterium]
MKKKLQVVATAFAAVLLFAAVAQAADKLVLPTKSLDTKQVILTTCYLEGKSKFVPKASVPEEVTKEEIPFTEQFVGTFAAAGFNVVQTGCVVPKDDEEGGITLLAKILFVSERGKYVIAAEGAIKDPGKMQGILAYAQYINGPERGPEGKGATGAGKEIAANLLGKIMAAQGKSASAAR